MFFISGLKKFIIGLVIGLLVGLWFGSNLGKGRPLYSNPLASDTIQDKIISTGDKVLEKSGEALEKSGKALREAVSKD